MVKKVALIILIALCVVLPAGAYVYDTTVSKYSFNYVLEFFTPHTSIWFSSDIDGDDRLETNSKHPLVVDESGNVANVVQYYIVFESNEGATSNLSIWPDAFRVYEDGVPDSSYGSIAHTLHIILPEADETESGYIDVSVPESDSSQEAYVCFASSVPGDAKRYIYSVSYIVDEKSYSKAAATTYESNVRIKYETIL